ncbi:MAG: MptD family putative ECF transporter S component [Propionibacteriaceae bacterium]|nr:MptD family putative ECF transporter S component [Propionibacteriaceae bacterium]
MSESTTVRTKNSLIRDIVTMGVFIALYLLVAILGGMVFGFIPFIMVILPLLSGLFGGLVFSVMLGRVQRPGAFIIATVILGLMLISMAPGGTMFYCTILGGIAGEIIYSLLGRKSFKSMCIAYAALTLGGALGQYIPFVWMKEAYLAQYANSPTFEIARYGVDILNLPLMIVLCAVSCGTAVLGCLWGRAMTRKQFAKAGIV